MSDGEESNDQIDTNDTNENSVRNLAKNLSVRKITKKKRKIYST